MSRMDGNDSGSRTEVAAEMESSYFEMDEAILSMESTDEATEAKRLKAMQSRLADRYFFTFIRPRLDEFPQPAA